MPTAVVVNDLVSDEHLLAVTGRCALGQFEALDAKRRDHSATQCGRPSTRHRVDGRHGNMVRRGVVDL
ncbi:hypothetical protein G6F24_018850 [Rhizopus arrhizus]|nr:hypothetical protein G6F24_018850 [Rhizopus arrhizus]